MTKNSGSRVDSRSTASRRSLRLVGSGMSGSKSPRPRKFEIAVPLHGYRFDPAVECVELEPSLHIRSMSTTRLGRLYEELCETQGIDDKEPLDYEVYAHFERSVLDFGDPCSEVDRLINLLVVVTSHPIDIARVIWSSNGFQSADGTITLFYSGAQLEFISLPSYATITPAVADSLTRAYAAQQAAWDRSKANGCLTKALTYFNFTWRAPYADQMGLNLAVVLAILFAPNTHEETAHQIAFNVARYLGGTPREQERMFGFVRLLYAMRTLCPHINLSHQ